MQLIPGRTFTVVRQIGNHTDTGTYYVRAVIRNAYSDAILDTLDLTDKGGQRFKKDWLVPSEPSGLGAFISIVTSVYTDSGYTTKSDNYADEENTYLWAVMNFNSGGGFSEKFDYRRVADIVDKAIATIPPPPPFPEIPTPKEYEMRWDEVFSRLDTIESKVAALPTENNDDAPIMAKLEELVGAVEAKDVTPETDLSPVISAVKDVEKKLVSAANDINRTVSGFEKKVVDEVGETVSELFDKTSFVTSFSTHVAKDGDMMARHKKMMQKNIKDMVEPEEDEKEEPEDPDLLVKSLTS